MAIPLIQNVEKQDINTSIIAIRRQLEQLYNALGVTENTVSSEDISKSTGTPLGTWASFVNDSAPNGEWLESGSTFNENTYPALAMMLGGNVVPIMYDHNRPSELETFTISTNSSAQSEILYDGLLLIFSKNSSMENVYVNNIEVARDRKDSSYASGSTVTVPVKKGDFVYLSRGYEYCYAQFYKHPLFIKATPTSSDSDYEGTLNAIREFYVRNNTYSTEERLTGGVWIDGKPIYRKAVLINITISGNWGNTNIPNPYYTGYTGDIERIITCTCTDGQATSLQVDMSSPYQYLRVATGYGRLGTWTGVYLLLEYTKSTDS